MAVPVKELMGAPSDPKDVAPMVLVLAKAEVDASEGLVPVAKGKTAPLPSVVMDNTVSGPLVEDDTGVFRPSDPVMNDCTPFNVELDKNEVTGVASPSAPVVEAVIPVPTNVVVTGVARPSEPVVIDGARLVTVPDEVTGVRTPSDPVIYTKPSLVIRVDVTDVATPFVPVGSAVEVSPKIEIAEDELGPTMSGNPTDSVAPGGPQKPAPLTDVKVPVPVVIPVPLIGLVLDEREVVPVVMGRPLTSIDVVETIDSDTAPVMVDDTVDKVGVGRPSVPNEVKVARVSVMPVTAEVVAKGRGRPSDPSDAVSRALVEVVVADAVVIVAAVPVRPSPLSTPF